MVLVLFLAACVYFIGLNRYPLLDPDEGRYAEIPREMLELGDFITPRLNYVKYYEKPPLFYWVTAGSLALFGQHEWAVRVVPALAGLLTVLLIITFGNRFWGMRVGVLAGWIYLTSLVPLILARFPIIDGMFSLFLTATWMAWWAGYKASAGPAKSRWYLVAWACMGLAMMTKTFAAVVLTGIIVLAFIAARGDWRELGRLCWFRGLLIFFILVLPWHLAAGFRNPEFFHFYFIVQHFGRLVQEEHAKGFWFFLVVFPFGMLFWTALFFPAALASFRKAISALHLPRMLLPGKTNKHPSFKRSEDGQIAGDSEGVLFLALWVMVVVGLFSLSRSKLVPYILPAYPAMALLMAMYLMNGGLAKTSARWCAGILSGILLAATPFVSYYAGVQDMLGYSELEWPVRLAQAGLLLGGVLLGLAAFKGRLIPPATGAALLLLLPAVIMVIPVGANYRKVGGLMEGMPSPLPQEIRVAEWRTFDQGLSFYTQRRTILIDNIGELEFGSTIGDHSGFFLQGEESLKRLGREGPLLANIRPGDWPTVRDWGLFQLVAANSTNVMVGNREFFHLTGLAPWPDEAFTPTPRLLKPRSGAQNP